MNLAQFPRRGYVTTPTPIEHCPNFSKALGADIDVYIKRDDMLPGTAGGNKTRKLEYLLAERPAGLTLLTEDGGALGDMSSGK